MAIYQRLTDRVFNPSAITLNDLIHIVVTGDTSQSPEGSSYKTTIGDVAFILSGTSGTSGSSGIDGTSGSSGTSGIDGTSGTSGSSGTSGIDGTSGTSGSSGTSGIDGTSGSSGSSGTSGSSVIVTASNGLTESAGDITLGGTLTGATSVALDTHDLSFTGIGNVDIVLTYATGTTKTLLETGKDVLGFTALGVPNGVPGIGAMYMEDGADLLNSNSATFIAGDLSELGSLGTGMFMRVGDFNGNFPEAGISLTTDSVAGAAYVELFAYGFNTDQSDVVVMAEHDADIAYSVTSIGIGGPTGTKELVLSDSGWEILNDVDGEQYKFPWSAGTSGQVLADDGTNNLEWVDMGGGLFEENTTGGTQSTQRIGSGTASGSGSTISGGYSNISSGKISTVGGGYQ
jgi:hypothetical protein